MCACSVLSAGDGGEGWGRRGSVHVNTDVIGSQMCFCFYVAIEHI